MQPKLLMCPLLALVVWSGCGDDGAKPPAPPPRTAAADHVVVAAVRHYVDGPDDSVTAHLNESQKAQRVLGFGEEIVFQLFDSRNRALRTGFVADVCVVSVAPSCAHRIFNGNTSSECVGTRYPPMGIVGDQRIRASNSVGIIMTTMASDGNGQLTVRVGSTRRKPPLDPMATPYPGGKVYPHYSGTMTLDDTYIILRIRNDDDQAVYGGVTWRSIFGGALSFEYQHIPPHTPPEMIFGTKIDFLPETMQAETMWPYYWRKWQEQAPPQRGLANSGFSEIPWSGCPCTLFVDGDSDHAADCIDGCPANPDKAEPGACGCEQAEFDLDGDGQLECATKQLVDSDGDGRNDRLYALTADRWLPDSDGDGDLDLVDFAALQRCAWRAYQTTELTECAVFAGVVYANLDDSGSPEVLTGVERWWYDLDEATAERFRHCAAGPGIPVSHCE